MHLAGNNEDNLAVNEWRQEVDGRNGVLKYEVDMGDFIGYALNEISEKYYQIMSVVYFTTHQQVFYIEWYDHELRDEERYKIYIEILKSFRQNSY